MSLGNIVTRACEITYHQLDLLSESLLTFGIFHAEAFIVLLRHYSVKSLKILPKYFLGVAMSNSQCLVRVTLNCTYSKNARKGCIFLAFKVYIR